MGREKLIREEVELYIKRTNYDIDKNVYNSLVSEVAQFLDNFEKIVSDALEDESALVRMSILSKINMEDECQLRDYSRF